MKNKISQLVFLVACFLVTVISCKKTDDSVTTVAPTIISFSPTTGAAGTTVTITGTNFNTTAASNTVMFNGVAATVMAATATALTVTVPAGATTGMITVTVGSQTATSSTSFTVTTASTTTSPTITAFSPTSGSAGAAVVITGTNFSTTPASNTVTFNGVAATVSAATTTSLTVAVPAGATTGKIVVTVGSSTIASTADFTVSTTGTTATPTQVVALANAFLATLSTTQQASVVVALNLANAKKWSNLPCGLSCRQGLAFSSLSATQLVAAKAVIQAASGTVANEGYSEFIQINAADDVLATTGGSGYSSGNYIIAFLGTPSTTGKWMLQFGGHHYAQSVTYNAGTVVSTTPSHQGIEPKSWTANGVTYAPLAEEVLAMAAMLASFTTAELASAKISSTFSDVTMVPGSTTNTFPTTKLGIKVSSLSTAAQAKVLAAMAPWLNDLDDATAATFMSLYASELANTYVTYAGNASGTAGNASSFFTTNTDYVRIDGPSVWIEFICQTGVVYRDQIHYHSVYRDHTRDYIGL